MRSSIVVTVFGLAISAGIAVAQSKPSIKFGPHEVTLGATVDTTVADLQQQYSVEYVHEKNSVKSWLIKVKGNRLAIVGELYARKNLIVGVFSDHEISSLADMFGSLYEASSGLDAANNPSCSISTVSQFVPSPNLSKAAIIFDCGEYRFHVQRNNFDSSDGETLTDYLVVQELGETDY